jgi:hypothetical protein
MEVGRFLELQRALASDRVVEASPEKEEIHRRAVLFDDLAHRIVPPLELLLDPQEEFSDLPETNHKFGGVDSAAHSGAYQSKQESFNS